MATSPLFGWEEPDDVDLVKDGAAAIRTLGNAIDTSMGDLLGGTTGQVLAKASNTNMDFTWVAQDDSNAIQNAIVDAKGDLIAATAADTPARLAVGTNGQVLTADSTASTGLAWATPSGGSNTYYAGKNKIINGDFGIWQRGTSFTSTYAYNADRFQWYTDGSGAVVTCSQQTFTPASAPVSGYEGTYFLQIAQTTAGSAATANILFTNMEDVRLFAGQTITISFWAKAASGTPIIKPNIRQFFGSGGSSLVDTAGSNITISTSWTRYSQTFSVPSISGKTIGTGSYLQLGLGLPFNTVQTISFWGVQLEAGSTATDFVTASGNSKQGELALCQRYYYRLTATQSYSDFGAGYNANTTNASYMIPFPVSMRITPTAMEQTGTAADYNVLHSSGGSPARAVCSAVPSYQVATPTNCRVYFTVASGLTAGNGSVGGSNNNTNAYLGWSAEL